MEKILEDALIKLSTVLSDLFGSTGRAMLEALIAGQRDPRALAELAHPRVKSSRATLIEALTGQFTDHHAYLIGLLLGQIDELGRQITNLTARIDEHVSHLPAAQPSDTHMPEPNTPPTGPHPSSTLPALDRLDEIPGIAARAAQIIIAEIGLDMTQFPTAAHLVSWAKLAPHPRQSGTRNRSGSTGKGNPYLKGVLGEAASSAGRTDTFLGERY
ncbi:IS110 family transposase [Nonomuraea fuscirosea]|uniref:IS110 family transposase n=1 Tax=Nonomuraea fuscirosea TaxID=1291556 RepID=UPI0034206EE5